METRPYKSVRRAEAAAATRSSILEAAQKLFRSEGYQSATVTNIALSAGVSVNAVYSSIGGKAYLLVTLVRNITQDATIRSALADLAPDASGRTIVRTLAHSTRNVLEQHHWLLSEMFDNAASDEAIREAIHNAEDAYRSRVAKVAAMIADRGALRADVTPPRAAEILRFHFSFTPWRELRNAQWGWVEAEDWLVDQAAHALIRPQF